MKKIVIIICMIFILCGCGLSDIAEKYQKKDDEEKQEMYDLTIPLVKKYIKDKYGFVFLDSDIDKVAYPCYFSPPMGCNGYDGTLEIKAHYNGVDYKIHADTDKIDSYTDTYEKEKAINKIKKYLSDYFKLDTNYFVIAVNKKNYEDDFYFHKRVDELNSLNELITTATGIDLITYKSINKNDIDNMKNKYNKIYSFWYHEIYNYDLYIEYLRLTENGNTRVGVFANNDDSKYVKEFYSMYNYNS